MPRSIHPKPRPDRTICLAVLAKNGIPTHSAVGNTEPKAIQNLIRDLRATDEFSDFPEGRFDFQEAIRESDEYGFDSFTHKFEINPTAMTRTVVLHFGVISENGFPMYTGCGLTEREATHNALANLRDGGDFEEFSAEPDTFLDELLGPDGFIGESEDYGFEVFSHEVIL